MSNNKMKGHGILQIRKPFGKATLLIFTFTALLILLFELFASSTYAQPLNLPYQSIDSNLDDLEIKLSLLKAFVEENGQLECLLLGSSEINGGIDPDVLSNAFAEVTGAHLNCFNFGLPGAGPITNYLVATLIFQEHSPQIVIYGYGYHGYSKNFGDNPYRFLKQNPWVRHKLGDENLEGWLLSNSASYQFLINNRNWAIPDFSQVINSRLDKFSAYAINGFSETFTNGIAEEPKLLPAIDVLLSQLELTTDLEEKENLEKLIWKTNVMSDYVISNEKIQDLDKLMELMPSNQMVLVENPVHETLLSFYKSGLTEYYKAQIIVDEHIADHHVLHLKTYHLNFIPPFGWVNRHHLNHIGASAYSNWLGNQLGQAVLAGEIVIPITD